MVLTQAAKANRVAMREAREKDINASLRKEVAWLKDTLRNREKEIRDKDGEIASLKRGRQGVVTRGSSVQPGAAGTIAGGLAGTRSPRGGSRGVSPALAGGTTGRRGRDSGGGTGGNCGQLGDAAAGGVAMQRGLSGLSNRL